jgi:hypothetical protein
MFIRVGGTLSAIGTAQRIDIPLATCDKSIRPLLDRSNALNIASMSAADLLTQIHAEAAGSLHSSVYQKVKKCFDYFQNRGGGGCVMDYSSNSDVFGSKFPPSRTNINIAFKNCDRDKLPSGPASTKVYK